MDEGRCAICGLPPEHAERGHAGYRYWCGHHWCGEHAPWPGHWEHCGDLCVRLKALRILAGDGDA